MSTNLDKTSKTYSLSVSSLLVRTVIYSGFMAGIMASFYSFKFNTIVISSMARWPEVKQDITSINEAQQAYYAKNNKFSDSLEELGVKTKGGKTYASYNYRIMSSIGPVETLGNSREPAEFESTIVTAICDNQSKLNGAVSYTGAVFTFKEDVTNQVKTVSAICEDQLNTHEYISTPIQPTFDGREIECPWGTKILR